MRSFARARSGTWERLHGWVPLASRQCTGKMPVAPHEHGARTIRSRVAVAVTLIALAAPAQAAAPAGSQPEALPSNETKVAEKTGPPPGERKWRSLFDGKALGRWKVLDEFDYSRHGKVDMRDGRIVLEAGNPATGVRWTGPFPKIDYEVTLEAMRVEGDDFFCALTFPVGDAALTLVLGGWGGSIVGLSMIDGEMAVENETCLYKDFDQKRWYRLRLRVTRAKVEAWIDKHQVVELATEGRKLTVSWEMEPPLPFGAATWRTTGALRDLRVRPIGATLAKP